MSYDATAHQVTIKLARLRPGYGAGNGAEGHQGDQCGRVEVPRPIHGGRRLARGDDRSQSTDDRPPNPTSPLPSERVEHARQDQRSLRESEVPGLGAGEVPPSRDGHRPP